MGRGKLLKLRDLIKEQINTDSEEVLEISAYIVEVLAKYKQQIKRSPLMQDQLLSMVQHSGIRMQGGHRHCISCIVPAL